MIEEQDPLSKIAEDAKNELVPLLHTALTAAAERHQLTLNAGSDSFSFGTDAWSFPQNFFKNHLSDSKGFIMSSKGGCVLLHGKYEIRHHRVGDSVSDDITSSFPKGAKAIVEDVKEQFTFPFMQTDNAYAGHIVLAYMANPAQGLCKAYLAVPNKIENEKIQGWGKIVEIYKLDDNTDSFTQDNGSDLADPEYIEEPRVKITKRQKQKTEKE